MPDLKKAWSASIAAVSAGGGGLIAFYPNTTGSNDICVMNADGSNIQQLSFDDGDARVPSWSRDGAQIVIQSSRDGATNLCAVDPDDGNLQALTAGPGSRAAPVWQP